MTPRSSGQRSPDRMGWALWPSGLLVAACAGVATAHGLHEVAAVAGVQKVIAWLYPLITDGLALVAYASTTRLTGRARRYASVVVVLAAGLSGLAQAIQLASGSDGKLAVPEPLRFGIGAWPAIAAAIAAHLLFMLGGHHVERASADRPDAAHGDTAPGVEPPAPPVVQAPVQAPVQSAVQSAVQPVGDDTVPREQSTGAPSSERRSTGRESQASERARTAARRHAARHGGLPTVTALMALAEVSRGTAGAALKDLRAQPAPLQIVHDDTQVRTQP